VLLPQPAAPLQAAAPAPVPQPGPASLDVGGELPPEFSSEQDFSSEPLESRFASKDLNRRCSAYNEISGVMSAGGDGAAASFELFRKNIDTCLAESLPKGQDAALSALTTYLQHCPDLSPSDVMPLVRRLLEHKSIDKPKMQQLVPPVILLVTEIAECAPVVAEISACLSDLENAKKKVAGFYKKQVAVIIKLFQQLLNEFGPLKMAPKLGYVNLTAKCLSDTDRGIKEACYGVLVELSCWLGEEPDAAKTLEDPQKKEVVKRFEAMPVEEKVRGQPQRHYRAEKLAMAAGGVAVEAKPMDKFALSEALDITKKLPKGWCIEKIFAMEKWKEKQVYLQELSSIMENTTKLAASEGIYALVPSLARLIKTESNLPVATEAAKCMGLMAQKLRRDFERPARQLLPICLARINDKSVWKPSILIERVEQLLWSLPFEFLLNELHPHIESKSLFVKKEAINLLLRSVDLPAVKSTCPDALKQCFPALASTVVPLMDDSDNGVRHEAAKFLVVLVVANLESPEAGPLVLDRIPTHRAGVFEEEWRKVSKDLPCPLRARSSTPLPMQRADASAPASGSAARSASGLRPRPGVEDPGARANSRPVSPLRGLTPRGARPASPLAARGSSSKMMESPSKKMQAPSPQRRPESPGRSTGFERSTGPIRARSPSVDKSAAASVGMQQMAEEIRSLRTTVSQLQQRDKDVRPSGARTPRGSALVAPPAPEPRRPATPPPKRPQSWDGTHRLALAEPPCSTPRRHSASSSAAASPPPKVASPPPAAPAQRGFVRSASADLSRNRRPREDSAGPPLSRMGSSSTLPSAFSLDMSFDIFEPRHPKHVRQEREKCQYWGPDKVPAEHLSALKDAWKQCVDQQMLTLMFSDKLEEQLAALQSWKMKVSDEGMVVEPVLDMLLKWLTWMIFTANTQVWKAILEVLSCTLKQMEAVGLPLTDREAQILMPNILERSGHNIAAVREGMEALIRQTLAVHPKAKLLPILMQGLLSKNKRSVACAMRGIGEAVDKNVAATLARSQKDLASILKLVDEKDADVKKAATNTVATLSLFMDNATFGRIIKGLPPNLQQVVRSAAAKMVPMPAATMSMSAGEAQHQPTSARGMTRSQSGGFAPPAAVAPVKTRAASQGMRQEDSPVQRRPMSITSPSNASKLTLHLAPPAAPAASPGLGVSPIAPATGGLALSPMASMLTPSPIPGDTGDVNSLVREVALQTAPISQLAERVPKCGGSDDFRILCSTLKSRMKQVREADSVPLAEAMVSAMRMYLGHDRCADRCKPLVDLLEEFCASRDCLRPLDSSLLRGLLREQLRNLHDSKWTLQLEGGTQLLRTINLSCVMLLNNIPRSNAMSLLLQLGTEESEVIASSLVVKCLRKVAKGLGTHRDLEAEVAAVLQAMGAWLRRAQPRLSSLLGVIRESTSSVAARSLVDAAVCALLEGVREVVDLAQQTRLEQATAWAEKLRPEERKLLQACQPPIGVAAAPATDKENVPIEIPCKNEAAAAATGTIAKPPLAPSSPTPAQSATARV